MSLAVVQIEQLEASRWHAELEVGGSICRRIVLNSADFEGIISALIEGYRSLVPAPAGVSSPLAVSDGPRSPRHDRALSRSR